MAAISSPGRSAFCFTPVQKSPAGIRREPSADAVSTTAPDASRTGSVSPAGDAEPRFPPSVPRLRICGEPTVRDAMASPGSAPPSSAISVA